MVEETDVCRDGTNLRRVRRFWRASAQRSAQVDRRHTRATTSRFRSTSRSPLGRRTACRTGRTRRIRALSGNSSSHSFRLRPARSGSLKNRFFKAISAENPSIRHSYSTVNRSAADRRRRRGPDAPCTGRSAPRSFPSRTPCLSSFRPHWVTAPRSSASLSGCRTSSLR
jgi:hypothetical protein